MVHIHYYYGIRSQKPIMGMVFWDLLPFHNGSIHGPSGSVRLSVEKQGLSNAGSCC